MFCKVDCILSYSNRTQQLLTRFHSLNLHDPLVSISPPASSHDDHVVNYRCSCGNIGVTERTASHLSDSSQSDDEEDEEEDNSLTVQQILSMLIAAEVKGHISPSRASVLKNLASSCNSEDRVSDVYLRQVSKHEESFIRECFVTVCIFVYFFLLKGFN